LAHVFGQVGDESPDMEDAGLLARAFDAVQELLEAGAISAGHDRSDGGLITSLLEMAFAGNCGIEIELPAGHAQDPLSFLFSEELGLVLEVGSGNEARVLEIFRSSDVPCVVIGTTTTDKAVRVGCAGRELLNENVCDLRDVWEETSFQLDRLQADPDCVEEERAGLCRRAGPTFKMQYSVESTPTEVLEREDKPRVAVVREEGSNGDREMTSAFFVAGFEPWDVSMSDLLDRRISLRDFRGVVFVGGFSYADVLDSGKGWAGVIRFNEHLWRQFQDFYERTDTFSLGVCNGCQLHALLGWVPWRGIADAEQPRFVQNASGRFESRFAAVRVMESPAIMLRGMEGSVLGIWVAHGEGRAFFPEESVLTRVNGEHLAPIRFVNDEGEITEAYPFNPNGSRDAIAALCSVDGRHLAMMPHPERTFLKWQWGWMSEEWKRTLRVSPWLRMFQNARAWCEQTG
jgi:phosphoribosylformylglycinamidine synthase